MNGIKYCKKKLAKGSVWLTFFCLLVSQYSCSRIHERPNAPFNLRVEYKTNPIGINESAPRFSWVVNDTSRGAEQSAWQVLVATKKKELEQNKGDIWDSGKVNSNQNIQVAYRGTSLKSGQQYFWKVRTWDEHGNVSPYSEIGWWKTGFLHHADWKGSWIYNGESAPDNPEAFYEKEPVALFRKAFSSEKKVADARLYISGLGYYEAHMNGIKIGDRVLEPGPITGRLCTTASTM